MQSTGLKAEWQKCKKRGRIRIDLSGNSCKGFYEKNTGRRRFFGSKNLEFSGSKKVIEIPNSSMHTQRKEGSGSV